MPGWWLPADMLAPNFAQHFNRILIQFNKTTVLIGDMQKLCQIIIILIHKEYSFWFGLNNALKNGAYYWLE